MDRFLQLARLKLLDLLVACRFAAFPDDRPSPLFSLATVFINGGLLVWSFSIIVSADCASSEAAWMSVGIVHAFINNLFAIAIMVRMRLKISKGILLKTSAWSLVFLDPIVAIYVVYLIWEIVWMAIVAQHKVQTKLNGTTDACINHYGAQIGFYVFFLLGCSTLFWLTFVTEWCRVPKWRRRANVCWYLRHQPEALIHLEDDEPLEETQRESIESIRTVMQQNETGSAYQQQQQQKQSPQQRMQQQPQEEANQQKSLKKKAANRPEESAAFDVITVTDTSSVVPMTAQLSSEPTDYASTYNNEQSNVRVRFR